MSPCHAKKSSMQKEKKQNDGLLSVKQGGVSLIHILSWFFFEKTSVILIHHSKETLMESGNIAAFSSK